MKPEYLVLLSALIAGSLGSIHLVWTFRGPMFDPRDAQLKADMQRVSPVLTRETTMWLAWVGFNGSHSMGAMLYALVYGYLAIAQPALLFGSWYLQGVGVAMLGGYFLLARRYWFSKPRLGVTASLLCLLAGLVWAHAP